MTDVFASLAWDGPAMGPAAGESLYAPLIGSWDVKSRITDHTFHWRGEGSKDGGTSWRLDQEMECLRSG